MQNDSTTLSYYNISVVFLKPTPVSARRFRGACKDPLRYKVPGDPSRGRGYSPRMEHAIDYKSVLGCGIHQDWTPDS